MNGDNNVDRLELGNYSSYIDSDPYMPVESVCNEVYISHKQEAIPLFNENGGRRKRYMFSENNLLA